MKKEIKREFSCFFRSERKKMVVSLLKRWYFLERNNIISTTTTLVDDLKIFLIAQPTTIPYAIPISNFIQCKIV